MSFLGFDALGKLALGQLPNIFTNFFFSLWDQPKTKKQVPDSFTGFVFVPKTTPVVFSTFSQPTKVTVQQAQVTNTPRVAVVTVQPYVFSTFSQPSAVKVRPYNSPAFEVGKVVLAVTPTALVFTKFSEPSFYKVRPQSNTNSSFFVQPAVATVVVGGGFSDFDLIQSKKNIQTGFSGFVFVPPVVVQPYIFSKFEQPQLRKTIQDFDFDDFYQSSISVPVQFSDFEQPSFKRVLQQDQSFVNFPTVQVVIQPYVFGQFDQPQTKRIQQADDSFVNFPVVVTPVINFTGFVDSIPLQKRFIDGFITSTQPQAVQSYVFTPFSQPQTKKQIYDQFTWSIRTLVSQPYVFSSFSQPFGLRSQEYLHQLTQSVLYPTIIVPLPDFIGFNDFGLTQQRVGTQNRQDASSVQFQILPMPQIISVVSFTGFSDFSTLVLSRTSTQYPGVVYEIFVGGPAPFPDVAIGGGKRIPKIPKVNALDSSNIAEVAYDEDFSELNVKFKNDKIYKYTNVNPKRVKGLIKAKSAGKYFHRNIKDSHFTTRVK